MGSLIDGFKKAQEKDLAGKQREPEEEPRAPEPEAPPSEAEARKVDIDVEREPPPAAPAEEPEAEGDPAPAIPPEILEAEEVGAFGSAVLESSLRVKELEAELEETRRKLEDKTQTYDKVYDQLVRVAAEFENFKKRAQKERAEAIKFGNERLLLEVLPTVDNLERALAHAGEDGESNALVEGIKMVLSSLLSTLEKHGVKPVDSLGAAFDPNVHNAVMELETTEANPGTVVAEFQKGYMIADRLLRAAMVQVAKAPAGAESADAPQEASPPEAGDGDEPAEG